MNKFIQGAQIVICKAKNGQALTLRYPKWEDLYLLTDYINELSKEDTYIIYSGEQNTPETEVKYLSEVLEGHEFGNMVKIMAFAEGELAGACDISRVMSGKKRELHVGSLGLTVRKKYRSIGLGEILIRKVLEEAKKNLAGLKIVKLYVYEPNEPARALYKKVGFTECGRLPGGLKYKEKYYDMIEMYLVI